MCGLVVFMNERNIIVISHSCVKDMVLSSRA